MTRHVAIVTAEIAGDSTETDANSLSAKVYAVVNTKTIISISLVKFGRDCAALVVYDDA